MTSVQDNIFENAFVYLLCAKIAFNFRTIVQGLGS